MSFRGADNAGAPGIHVVVVEENGFRVRAHARAPE
jgi:hypothetical protein